MLITPTRSGIGGKVDLDVSIHRKDGPPNTLKWTAEGGHIEGADTPHAKYTCDTPGLFRVRLRVANGLCETSQESHIYCVD